MLASILFSFASMQANGAIVNQLLPNTNAWIVYYDTNEIQNLTFNSTGYDKGTLKFTTVFTSTSYPYWTSGPQISFVSASQEPGPGLILLLNDTVVNNTGRAMNGLQFGLMDFSVKADVGSPAHPGTAHFHATVGCTNTQQLFSPFTLGGSNNTFDPICNNKTLGETIDLSGGTIANGETANFSQFRLHEWEVPYRPEVFDFYQLPTLVPEPSSIALLGVGLLGLAAVRSRRKSRA